MPGYSDGSYAVRFAADYDESKIGMTPQIYVIWHDWANYHEAEFTDRKKAADYIRQVRQYAPQHLTRMTIVHS